MPLKGDLEPSYVRVRSVYTSDVNVLRGVASEVCSRHNTLCFADRDPDELVWFGFTWVETFYYVNPEDCASDLKCLDTLFNMHWEVFKLASRGEYMVYIDRDLLDRAVTKLLRITEVKHV